MLQRETNAHARAAAKNPTALAKAVGAPGSPAEQPQGRVTPRWQSGGERARQQQWPPGCVRRFSHLLLGQPEGDAASFCETPSWSRTPPAFTYSASISIVGLQSWC